MAAKPQKEYSSRVKSLKSGDQRPHVSIRPGDTALQVSHIHSVMR